MKRLTFICLISLCLPFTLAEGDDGSRASAIKLRDAMRAIEAAREMPDSDSVVELMKIIESDEVIYRLPFPAAIRIDDSIEYVKINDEYFDTPADSAARLLSRMIANPPMTYSNREWDALMFFENALWLRWWRENKTKVLSGGVEIRTTLRAPGDVTETQRKREIERLKYVKQKVSDAIEHEEHEKQKGNYLYFYNIIGDMIDKDTGLGIVGYLTDDNLNYNRTSIANDAQSAGKRSEKPRYEPEVGDFLGGNSEPSNSQGINGVFSLLLAITAGFLLILLIAKRYKTTHEPTNGIGRANPREK